MLKVVVYCLTLFPHLGALFTFTISFWSTSKHPSDASGFSAIALAMPLPPDAPSEAPPTAYLTKSTEPKKISLQTLAKEKLADGVFIEIKGFLYRSSEGMTILAAEPNLKSCCIGSKNKAHQQIVVAGNLSLPALQHVVTLHGELHRSFQRREKGAEAVLYTLKNAAIIEGVPFDYSVFYKGALLAAIVFLAYQSQSKARFLFKSKVSVKEKAQAEIDEKEPLDAEKLNGSNKYNQSYFN